MLFRFLPTPWLLQSGQYKKYMQRAALVMLCLVPVASPLSLGVVSAFAEDAAYGKTPLTLRQPSGFVDSITIAEDLFRDTQSSMNGILLKLYLPSSDALLYEEKRRDSITRQVAIYGWPESETLTLDKKALELAAKTLEGAYVGYEVIPAEKLREMRKDDALMREAYRAVLEAGASLLVEISTDDQSITYVTLVNYPFTPPRPATGPLFAPSPKSGTKPSKPTTEVAPPSVVAPGLVTALSTTLVLVNDNIVFITASSLITAPQPDNVGEHLAWTTSASESFANMLISLNKK